MSVEGTAQQVRHFSYGNHRLLPDPPSLVGSGFDPNPNLKKLRYITFLGVNKSNTYFIIHAIVYLFGSASE
jgi:hypothetical protein